MTGPDTVPDADDSSIAPDDLRSQLAEKERSVDRKIDVLDRVIAHLEASTSRAEKP